MLQWRHINEPFSYGWSLVTDDKVVELIRAAPGKWMVFLFQDGEIVRGGNRYYLSYHEAMKKAKLFIKGM